MSKNLRTASRPVAMRSVVAVVAPPIALLSA